MVERKTEGKRQKARETGEEERRGDVHQKKRQWTGGIRRREDGVDRRKFFHTTGGGDRSKECGLGTPLSHLGEGNNLVLSSWSDPRHPERERRRAWKAFLPEDLEFDHWHGSYGDSEEWRWTIEDR